MATLHPDRREGASKVIAKLQEYEEMDVMEATVNYPECRNAVYVPSTYLNDLVLSNN